ncbi:ATP-dependent protease ATPase subunit HslU [Candidatus Neoehrlichia procyonis]|uniref:ATP-dependent protease HslVU, ATPase subunit n=1 Tax=Candidatus Neoehrlichia procyonis str. RAC413 TaxID=1359163 RepID=A0A0F3NN86_9RICK|nr:ATP-dependent protease ATPase subunit HslU [Candidatus Neoehrlichia lotoris]KJV69528.1 ATP-dependent protease HslVU, ATPase subunit [Candidatus Neoehrlichia lotoris str. RAC413]
MSLISKYQTCNNSKDLHSSTDPIHQSQEDSIIQELSPKQITQELDRFIIGQAEAKRAVAIALRNRWRRNKVPLPLREEIIPKNILMIGHTGIGKTEIARRLAKLANAPFIKVEATKFTEVGYVGRDVDSIIRDLVDIAIGLVKKKYRKIFAKKAAEIAENIILNALIGQDASEETRNTFQSKLAAGEFEDSEISISVKENKSIASSFDIPGIQGGQVGIMNINEIVHKMLGNNKQLKTINVTVKEAREILIHEETEKLIDEDKIIKEALYIASNDGIVFLDEIDKIAARTEIRGEVNREGVQRDLLPLLEGTSVTTKYGTITTDHILFIASGAFHLAKPSDLLPELQGRLPIRVELNPLSKDDLIKILTEPESSLLKQYCALMKTENVTIDFSDDGVSTIAEIASVVNREVENIGARRLHTILEKLMEDISYTASENSGKTYIIDEQYVKRKLEDISKQLDLSKFIL